MQADENITYCKMQQVNLVAKPNRNLLMCNVCRRKHIRQGLDLIPKFVCKRKVSYE